MTKWNIDPDHSVAAFEIRHLTVAKVRGQFNRITGTIIFDPADMAGASVDAEIDLGVMTTGIVKRDEHLFSSDFFEKDKYPSITFTSTRVDVIRRNRARVSGNLTIHGIKRLVMFEAEFSGPVKSPFGGETTIGFSAAFRIDRFDFDIKWNELMEDGRPIVGRDVNINLDIEADQVTE